MNISTFRLIKQLLLICTFLLLISCNSGDNKAEKKELLIYCGITMVKPISEIAKIIEEKENIKIHISQGGSQDLYDSLSYSKTGDLYFPGSSSYREINLDEGLLKAVQLVGYNQSAFLIKKNNPKNITANLDQLLRDDISVTICNPESGSIGRETKNILEKAGIFEQALENTALLNSDSRTLNNSLKNNKADLTINWRATAFFENNINEIDVIDLPKEIAKPKKLQLNLLSFSKHPEIAKRFMDFAASEKGQAIFRQHGFLDKNMMTDAQ